MTVAISSPRLGLRILRSDDITGNKEATGAGSDPFLAGEFGG
ncbi:hypothetical protein [Fodinibius roseus]|nr:hypothetical protein [Fodinibius roseus]